MPVESQTKYFKVRFPLPYCKWTLFSNSSCSLHTAQLGSFLYHRTL